MRIFRYIIPTAILALAALGCSRGPATPDDISSLLPPMTPDYSGTPTIPRNIAPLRFRIDLPADYYQVVISQRRDDQKIVVNSKDGAIMIPEEGWASMLERAAGDTLMVALATRAAGRWTAYPDMKIAVDTAALTDWLVYRLIYPGYELWNEIGVYQRCPADWTEETLLDNSEDRQQCLNCHSFPSADPATMMLHLRGPRGGTIIAREGKDAEKVMPASEESPYGAAYPAWDPTGRFIAFAADEIQQFFHSSGRKTTEVVNLSGDLFVYDTQTGRSITDSLMTGDTFIETFPSWSPDGRTLFYCRADPLYSPEDIDRSRYDLVSRGFDPEACRFVGEPKVLYRASADSMSISVPRVSPDGRWLVLTRADYGNFMIWHPEAELCIIDLEADTIVPRSLEEVNARDAVDSYHSWSSDGRWLVFSSKRDDGLFARPYIARFDSATGRFSTPFVLPQASPDRYADILRSFNIPEFISRRAPHAPALREQSRR